MHPGAIVAALRPGQREEERPRVAHQPGTQAEGIIHLVGVTLGDIVLDARNSSIIRFARLVRQPAGHLERLASIRQRIQRLRRRIESEPEQRQRSGWMRAHGGVEGRRRLVAHEAGGMQTVTRCRAHRPQRGQHRIHRPRAGHHSRRMKAPPAPVGLENDGSRCIGKQFRHGLCWFGVDGRFPSHTPLFLPHGRPITPRRVLF
ncbi:MAG: hypothetical protein BWY76_03334 [bacterium ADurb.Bin429]|nr:MAG: hypothetical protein BWY76_03334 [bacterium ADurb.Bin429]